MANSVNYPIERSVDTIFNAPFAILMAIWSSFFVENWKQKESDLIFLWNLEDGKDQAQTDERKGKFKCEKSYDPVQNRVVKLPRGNRDKAIVLNNLFTICMIFLTVGTMVGFEYIIDIRTPKSDEIEVSWNPTDDIFL